MKPNIEHPAVKRIVSAIKRKRFGFERRLNASVYYNHEIFVGPLFSPYVPYPQIGWAVDVIEAACCIHYDYERDEVKIVY